jgi:outer membrane protein assembly factor BamB
MGIATWKVVDRNGAPALEAGWVSRKLVSARTPTIMNGVVFALSAGSQGVPAVLYALDGVTGKELWNSAAAITSFVGTGGLAAGGGRVYVGAHDGTQYAFGFPMEH